MNAIMDPSLLKKFLAGNATDEEIQLCEAFLADTANDLDLDETPRDSLLETLRNLKQDETITQSKDLIDKIHGMMPKRSIGQEELDRILAPAQADDELGRIGQYRVIEFIASGGMGLVFKAEDPNLNRLVCIKVLHPIMANHAEATERFERESKAAARLRHDRIVTVLDVGHHRGLPFLVMQLLDGQSLRMRLDAENPLPAAVAKKYAMQIAEGLRYAHGLGYLHRDIKPENIWITNSDDIKLLDFGLARVVNETTSLTNTGTIIGTPSYMSPEQVQGRELDMRSDLFSLGILIYEMLTGNSPFAKPNLFSTMMSIANDSIQLPPSSAVNAIPIQIAPIVKQLLEKDINERIQSADELITQLSEVDATSSIRARTSTDHSFVSGRKLVGLLGGLAGAAAMLLAVWFYQTNDKGTLVVQADPSINVNIADENVTVFDPVTGKKFQVQIGQAPLPSGVYQLELADDAGYQLSSNLIVIRRGKKEIVRIELKSNLTKTVKSDSPKTPNNRIKSDFDLGSLPTLNANSLADKLHLREGKPIAKDSLVTHPPKRNGVTTWSIEPVRQFFQNGLVQMRLNCDGSLYSTTQYDQCYLRIWDRIGNLQHLIPGQDKIVNVRWSPHPHTFAVVENGSLKKQVTI